MPHAVRRAFAASVIALVAAAPALAVPADFKAKADAFVEQAWPAAGPGAAVIVTEGGRTVYARGQGLADVEAKRPITPATVFRLGSITKQFAAAVILQLVDEGKLSLDDPVSKFVPDLPQPGASATVRQLLNHTVGVQSYTGIPGWMTEENTNRPYTTAEMIALFKDLPAPAKPGEKYDYNNSGYVLVGAVIEKVTGKSWHEAVAERITKPLGLRSTRYGVGEETIPLMARGYTDGENGAPKPAMKIHMSVPHAAGALVGTVEDLAAWGHALHKGKVVSRQSYAGMIAPTKLPDGKSVPYGYGIGTSEIRGASGIGHSGGIFGFTTDSVYIPEKDIFVAVFVNSDDPATPPGLAVQRLAALALGKPFPTFETVKADPASLEPLFGVYRSTEDGAEVERRFFARDGQLYTQRTGSPEMKVYPAGGDRFHYGPKSLNWFELKRDPAGGHRLQMHQNGADSPVLAARTGPLPVLAAFAVPRTTLERYAGSYALGKAPVLVALGEGDSLSVKLGGQEPVKLRALSSTEFAADQVGGAVSFLEEAGAVKALVIKHNGREMKAERVTAK